MSSHESPAAGSSEHSVAGHEHGAHPTATTYYTVFGILIGLLVLTVVIAEVDLGPLNFLVAVSIATTKALLIILYFMHVRYAKPLMWLVAGAGFFWLIILFGLTLTDYLSRGFTPFSE